MFPAKTSRRRAAGPTWRPKTAAHSRPSCDQHGQVAPKTAKLSSNVGPSGAQHAKLSQFRTTWRQIQLEFSAS